ncbi:MAG: class I SAM-dependent methyltransferase [Vicinamibacterales bacterium]
MRRPSWLGAPAAALAPRAAYDAWAAAYPPAPHNALMAAEQAAVLALLPDVRGRAVLDAGCGTGRYLAALAARGATRLTGVDFSPAMLARVAVPGSTRVLGDLTALPFDDGSMDVVVSGLALNDVAALDLALAELARVLAPGGTLVYSVIHPRGGVLGWRRTFPGPGGEAAIAGHWHPPGDHDRACAAAGLVVDRSVEPRVDGVGAVAIVRRAARAR